MLCGLFTMTIQGAFNNCYFEETILKPRKYELDLAQQHGLQIITNNGIREYLEVTDVEQDRPLIEVYKTSTIDQLQQAVQPYLGESSHDLQAILQILQQDPHLSIADLLANEQLLEKKIEESCKIIDNQNEIRENGGFIQGLNGTDEFWASVESKIQIGKENGAMNIDHLAKRGRDFMSRTIDAFTPSRAGAKKANIDE